VDASDAVEDHVWQSGFDDVLCTDRTPGEDLGDNEIQRLLDEWDTGTTFDHPRIQSLDFAMVEVALCLRALAFQKGIIDDPDFGDSHRSAQKFIERVHFGERRFPMRIIANTETSSSQGYHWFNIMFAVNFQ
jgi:hypothetical protein